MIIKYNANDAGRCFTDCPNNYFYGQYMGSGKSQIHVDSIACKECPHYSGPGPDPNTIICKYGEVVKTLNRVRLTQTDIDSVLIQSQPTDTIYVDSFNGNDDNSGSLQFPLKTIRVAIKRVSSDIENVIVIDNVEYSEE